MLEGLSIFVCCVVLLLFFVVVVALLYIVVLLSEDLPAQGGFYYALCKLDHAALTPAACCH